MFERLSIRRQRWFHLTWIAVLLLDQSTKLAVLRTIRLGCSIPVLGDFLRFKHVQNPASSFSLFHADREVFIVTSILSVLVVLVMLASGRYGFRGDRLAFGLITGGALGNLIDRVWLSKVVDFIDIGVGAYRWPTFNIADIGLTIGIVYVILRVFFGGERLGDPSRPQPSGNNGGDDAPR